MASRKSRSDVNTEEPPSHAGLFVVILLVLSTILVAMAWAMGERERALTGGGMTLGALILGYVMGRLGRG